MSTPPIPADPPSSPPSSGGVRRHHTITAASRSARGAAKETISEESQNPEHWNEDEFVGEEWVGGVGAVGEKSSLHRQASLPTKYHRGFQKQGSKSGTLTPKTLNSLTAIAGHEGDEEEWEREIGGYNAQDDEVSLGADAPASMENINAYSDEMSPPSTAGVRRHVSLTYGAQGVGGTRPKMASAGLKRAGTLQTPLPVHPPQSEEEQPAPEEPEYTYDDPGSYDDEYYKYGPTSPVGRSSPWGSGGQDWRPQPQAGNGAAAIDDVQRALTMLELSNNGGPNIYTANYPPSGQSAHPPRFNPPYAPPNQMPGMRNNNGAGRGNNGGKPPLPTEAEGRKTPVYGQGQPQSAPGSSWEQKDRVLTGRTSNPNLQQGYHSKSSSGSSQVPNVPPIPTQYLQQQQRPNMGATPMNLGGQARAGAGQPPAQGSFVNTSIDIPTLIATKGYNPTTFDTRPAFARYFVIKSYTEDDVHKSLKYEIWSSTDPGNKRLDKAFKEVAGRGPIYLFFSVNASGHFCGMAEMLTPVDYSRSSTVWASDKWKGVFKVRWIFVRDIPNANLRHIKLNNTQERKPVTNSRDTQELLPDAGLEMLRIFHSHPARTSLLQDFAFYELQAMQKMQAQSGASSPVANPTSPVLQNMSPVPQQAQFTNPNALAFQMPQMTPMMQMQMMGMNMGMGVPSAMQQSVMRNPSPGVQEQQAQFMGMQGF